ncbi:hypothetical protein L6452_12215 [Arctium lappa]|uniref:Uncharacterized protein n=1 Tax=Arctium lappa TaxID=4217 RepID=A0ACB9DQA4_ARCLA|nr:hypothetical protein L6452_12215 [Arctium lappa]
MDKMMRFTNKPSCCGILPTSLLPPNSRSLPPNPTHTQLAGTSPSKVLLVYDSEKAQVPNMRRQGTNKASRPKIQNGDSKMAATTCNTLPLAEMEGGVPCVKKSLWILGYALLDGQERKVIGVVSGKRSRP